MKEEYKEAYDKLAVSSRLHEKLMDIPAEEKGHRGKVPKAAVVFALLLIVILSYRAGTVTGQMKKQVPGVRTVYINGREIDSKLIEEETRLDQKGKTLYIVTVKEDELYGNTMIYTENASGPLTIIMDPVVQVRKQGKRYYLVIGVSGKRRIDITKALKKGIARGEFEADGILYQYRVIDEENGYQAYLKKG